MEGKKTTKNLPATNATLLKSLLVQEYAVLDENIPSGQCFPTRGLGPLEGAAGLILRAER